MNEPSPAQYQLPPHLRPPGAPRPPPPPPSSPSGPTPPSSAARASWLGLIILTAIDVVLAPFYFLMSAFTGHAVMTGSAFSLQGVVLFALAGASLACPLLAWLVQVAGGGRRRVLILALVPLVLPLFGMLASVALTPFAFPGGLTTQILGK